MGVIIFNGVSSKDHGIQVEHPPEYHIPAREYESIHIPGKNGDLIVDKGSYQNVTRQYQIAIGQWDGDFTVLANKIAEWLTSPTGYVRLEDSYEPDYFRMATYVEESTIENILHRAGRSTISFNCKPQRFLKSGEEPIVLTSSGKIHNPTNFVSSPIFKVYGSGKSNIGFSRNVNGQTESYTVSILAEYDYVLTFDSEIEEVYDESLTNYSSIVKVGDSGFPRLSLGDIEVIFTSNITRLEVIPRWWTL